MLNPKIIQQHDKLMEIKKWIKKESKNQMIDPLGIYCQHTGRCLGRINDDTLNIILQSLPPQMLEKEERESLWDELEIRALLSARPSPAWMNQSESSYKQLCDIDPIGAIVKYTGFAFISLWKHRKKRTPNNSIGFHEHQWISLDDRIRWQRTLIILFNKAQEESQFKEYNYMETLFVLLQADAKIGLSRIKPPEVEFPVIDSWDKITKYYKEYTENFLKNQARKSATSGSGFSWTLSEHIRKMHNPSKKSLLDLEKKEKRAQFDDIWNAVTLKTLDGKATTDSTLNDVLDASPVIPKSIHNNKTKFTLS